ncbi:hypothetical protein JCM19231_44 [Vibrio ishigakensis]|uniref:Uncharacterized protein n=1 Tax=Vibrio ishigakensis TaxID=1481914 RepID=A0A0B8P8V1_9VIBR|nr:hypothetical protein JCM19231_44 [Vibrio ishigakensis]
MVKASKVVLGIAGNSPGYLNQTGESRALDKVEDTRLPRALFPIYAENYEQSYLAQYPFSDSRLQLPEQSDAKVQMEPELALKLKVQYRASGEVQSLAPIALGLINDATHRNKTIDKLVQKKNWGASSKGISVSWLPIPEFEPALNHLRLCGFLNRGGEWYLCSQDVSVVDYHLFFEPLLDWIAERINSQQDEALFTTSKPYYKGVIGLLKSQWLSVRLAIQI